MNKPMAIPIPALSAATCEIASAYVSNNHVPRLICRPWSRASMPRSPAGHPAQANWHCGRTAIRDKVNICPDPKSITPDALISFIDGKPYKTLRRHLTARGFDPETYRKRYGLPADYPMVAPSYSARRSEISRDNSFGRHGPPLTRAAGVLVDYP